MNGGKISTDGSRSNPPTYKNRKELSEDQTQYKTQLNTMIHSDFYLRIFPLQSPEDFLKIQSRALKAYLLKNNLVPLIFVLSSPLSLSDQR